MLTQFAFLHQRHVRHSIGYGTCRRIETACKAMVLLFNPPFNEVVPLLQSHPTTPTITNKFRSQNSCAKGFTPTHEADLPEEVDYLIIGSGAGGASVPYRLLNVSKGIYRCFRENR